MTYKILKMQDVVRYKGKWYKIHPKPYEPETQTYKIAWMQIREPLITPEKAYRDFFLNQQKQHKILYPSFRKEENDK